MSGSGDVELDQVNGDRFTVASTGPGDLRASGSVRQLTLESSGSGDLDLRRLQASDVGVDMHGPGDVRLSGIGNTLAAQLRGSGDARIDGSVAQVSAQISGSGSLDGRRLSVDRTDISVRGPGSAAVNVVGKDGKGNTSLLVDRSGSHHSS